jgi:N-acetylglucosamine kinase-like BadF-type ATPase
MTNDAELALGALPDSVGLAVVSGTGSIAFGRNAAGQRVRAGGWGQIIGDEGSGYDLARRMFDAFAAEADGRGPSTSLTGRLNAELGLNEPHQLIAFVYSPQTSKGDLASLSRLVVEEADAGDTIALETIASSANQLVQTASAAARRLGFVSSLPLALTGGMLVHIDRFRNQVVDGLRKEWPGLNYTIVDDPALTAARSVARAYNTRVIKS